jgi:hypothetical protein
MARERLHFRGKGRVLNIQASNVGKRGNNVLDDCRCAPKQTIPHLGGDELATSRSCGHAGVNDRESPRQGVFFRLVATL